ncbi:MAG: hypothetical protein K6B64_01230 [Acholeplasmatales bacterium]|nr:hypothetical protein [Acholeplasmatales bacterium]
MPHVGGGSSGGGGGFHSGGSHSGSSTYVPKRDIYGNNHSRYYIRPGFYINHIYVPYSRVHRGFYAIRSYLFIFIMSLVLFGIAIVTCFINKTDGMLEDYSLNRYSILYSQDNNYEYNLLIEIIPYDNEIELDYLPIVGDNVSKEIDEMFGNQHTVFGGALFNKLETNENKTNNLYTYLAESLNTTCDNIHQKYYFENEKNTKIYNNTTFNLGSDIDLVLAMDRFFETTGYNIIIDVNYFSDPYHPNYILAIFFGAMGLIMLGISVFRSIFVILAVKKINQEDKNGNLEKYYEGEEKYEDHIKRHPIDEPYTYDKNEYEELKKEFTVDKSQYDINEDEYK